MLRAEILANRQKVITFLKQPKRLKTTGKLDKGDGARCCLGHMCYVLKVPRTWQGSSYGYGTRNDINYAPLEVINAVGLYYYDGKPGNKQDIKIETLTGGWESLAVMNDSTLATPQQIGTYLESVIEGGNNTPWKPLTDYPQS